MRSTIRVFQKTYAFLFRFNALALYSYRENHSTGLIPVLVGAVCHKRCVTINMNRWNKPKLQMFKKRLFPKLLFYISHYSGTNESREHGGT